MARRRCKDIDYNSCPSQEVPGSSPGKPSCENSCFPGNFRETLFNPSSKSKQIRFGEVVKWPGLDFGSSHPPQLFCGLQVLKSHNYIVLKLLLGFRSKMPLKVLCLSCAILGLPKVKKPNSTQKSGGTKLYYACLVRGIVYSKV